jgi:hypothetical protein
MDGSGKGEIKMKLLKVVVLVALMSLVGNAQERSDADATYAVVLNQDGSRKRESSTPDQLDAHGNWTKMTKWQTDAQGTRPLTVAYRSLSYY